MKEQETAKGMLAGGYRGLDLTDEKGYLCGKILGDFGADVIKIEKPGGDTGRRIAPFYKDILDPNKSLYWFAFNTSKRSITLNIETASGQEIFKKLAGNTDFIIESFAPGYMESLGLGYSQLSQVNPRIIMVSITPFGQSGPYRDYKASDIVGMAMSGVLYMTGDSDRCPVWTGCPQAYLFAAMDGAIGALTALYHRYATGEGDHVDASLQRSAYSSAYNVVPFWVTSKLIAHREGGMRRRPENNIVHRINWPCREGYVTFYYFGGRGVGARSNRALVEWMDSEGISCGFLKNMDWDNFGFDKITQDEVDQMEKPTAEFFMKHTKQELYEGAISRRILIYPVATSKDTVESGQLAARDYWTEIEHPELGTTITYPGPFVKASESNYRIWRRAPLIGEHNEEVYEKELGLTRQELISLRQGGII